MGEGAVALGEDVNAVEQSSDLRRAATGGTTVRAPELNDEQFLTSVLTESDRKSAAARVDERTAASIEAGGRGLCLTEADLSGSDLSQLSLRRADLTRARLASTNLVDADLSDATLICPLMERTTLRGANLRRFYGHAISIVSSDASGADLSGAIDCTGALFHGVNFSGADLSNGNFAGATFYQCQLTDTNLDRADLSGAVFNECLLYGTTMRGSVLEEATVLRSKARDVDLTGAIGPGLSIRSVTRCPRLVARHARLDGLAVRASVLAGADFSGTDLESAAFDDSSLADARFDGANMKAARLRRCSLTSASFNAADLTDAGLIDTRAPEATFLGARAENARMTRCSLPRTVFSGGENGSAFFGRGFTARDCDLSDARFDHAYLYRASFTGDPVTGMALDRSSFVSANLIQAYVAASLREADLDGVRAAYARLNQCDLSDSNLRGANLYQASLVKTVLAGACMTGVEAPVLLDRCPGLDSAHLDSDFELWLRCLRSALATPRRGST